jgi:hypothetical protein
MKRSNLLWFCGGAAASTIAGLAAYVLQTPQKEDLWFLRIAEDLETPQSKLVPVRWPMAEIARNCGAKVFDAIPGDGIDEGDAVRVPLTFENRRAMRCIIERAREANLWVGIQLEDAN